MIYRNETKRLVFHFFLHPSWKSLKCVRLHLNCLKKYSFIFTHALFVISVDDINDTDMILEFEHELLNLGFKGEIEFKVRENTKFYESKTLDEEIVQKLPELDGITFFGHSKGVGNELFDSVSWTQLETWIAGLYFLSLEFYYEAENKLYGVHGVTYGPFKTHWLDYDNTNHWVYSGTFFWVNTRRLYDKLDREGKHIRFCNDRFFSELFLGDVLPFDEQTEFSNVVGSHNESYLHGTDINYYDYVTDYIKMINNDRDYKNFLKFLEEVRS